MAAITLTQDHELTSDELKALFGKWQTSLPSYAMPRFLRVVPTMTVTSTFKQRKVDYVKEGYDPDKCHGDNIFVLDNGQHTYSPVTPDVMDAVNTGKLRL